MNFEQSPDFSTNISQLIKGSDENKIIQENYQKNVSLFKASLKIPKEFPNFEEIFNYFISLQEMNKSPKTAVLKSFFLRTKVFLVWLLSAYEFFAFKALEFFVKKTKILIKLIIFQSKTKTGIYYPPSCMLTYSN